MTGALPSHAARRSIGVISLVAAAACGGGLSKLKGSPLPNPCLAPQPGRQPGVEMKRGGYSLRIPGGFQPVIRQLDEEVYTSAGRYVGFSTSSDPHFLNRLRVEGASAQCQAQIGGRLADVAITSANVSTYDAEAAGTPGNLFVIAAVWPRVQGGKDLQVFVATPYKSEIDALRRVLFSVTFPVDSAR